MEYEPVIGLEIHVELNCAAKMFCSCPNKTDDPPNRNTCPVCLWFPGALPRFNGEALEKAALTALGLNCTLQKVSAFDQKVYYYPDLPKGFQLSQAHRPLARNGWIEITGENGAPRRLRIHKIHLEEDVARLVHEPEGAGRISLVDFNRAGVPLIEIVTEPDLRSPHEAVEFVRALRSIVRYLETSDGNMEAGALRVDANISLRPAGSAEFNTKVEVKNMNSLRYLGNAISYEIERQTACLRSGEEMVLHTRQWDPDKKVTIPMRGKFEGPCIPDPTLPPIYLDDYWISDLRSNLPELPAVKMERLQGQYGINRDEAMMITADREGAEYFEALVKLGSPPKLAAHWMMTQLLPALKEKDQSPAQSTVTPERMAPLLTMLEREEISPVAAREVLGQLFVSDLPVVEIVAQAGFRQISRPDELNHIVDQVLAANPGASEDYRQGITKALGFLIGQVMQATNGKANPKLAREIILARLESLR